MQASRPKKHLKTVALGVMIPLRLQVRLRVFVSVIVCARTLVRVHICAGE